MSCNSPHSKPRIQLAKSTPLKPELTASEVNPHYPASRSLAARSESNSTSYHTWLHGQIYLGFGVQGFRVSELATCLASSPGCKRVSQRINFGVMQQ